MSLQSDIQYHARALELLGIPPVQSSEASRAVDQWESIEGMSLPAAIREFYEIEGLVERLQANTCHHWAPIQKLRRDRVYRVLMSSEIPAGTEWVFPPIDLEVFTEDFESVFELRDDHTGFLLSWWENQACVQVYASLDEHDPSVFLDNDSLDLSKWKQVASKFSEFVLNAAKQGY